MEEEEAGSFSPELLHGDEDEEAIDPEEDRALLVSDLATFFNILFRGGNWVQVQPFRLTQYTF